LVCGGQELVSGTSCRENELEGCAISGDAQQWRRWTARKQGEFSSSRDSHPDRTDGTGDGYPFPIAKLKNCCVAFGRTIAGAGTVAEKCREKSVLEKSD